jgi:peptidoglycan/LPS O-acetylase OafA/YrhL
MKTIRIALATAFALASALLCYIAIDALTGGAPKLTYLSEKIVVLENIAPYLIGLGVSSYALFRQRRWVWVPYILLLLYHLGSVAFFVLSNFGSFGEHQLENILFLVCVVPIPIAILFLILELRRPDTST